MQGSEVHPVAGGNRVAGPPTGTVHRMETGHARTGKARLARRGDHAAPDDPDQATPANRNRSIIRKSSPWRALSMVGKLGCHSGSWLR